MFMRLFQSKVKPEAVGKLGEFYETKVIPELQKIKGCMFTGLVQDRDQPGTGISMTLWQTREDAEAFEKSKVYQKIMEEVEPILLESSEWKIQLTQDMELTYAPVHEEPIIKSYTAKAQQHMKTAVQPEITRMCTRIVSPKIQKGKMKEFIDIYKREIIPALQATDGCLHAYLMENLQEKEQQEVISLTIWESKEKAEQYEQSGQFGRLVDKVKHTFTQLSQWQMSLEKEQGKQAKTSDDMLVSHYTMVAGKQFKG
jgi:heme-degrading monooxygenase HmoA